MHFEAGKTYPLQLPDGYMWELTIQESGRPILRRAEKLEIAEPVKAPAAEPAKAPIEDIPEAAKAEEVV